MTTELMDLIYEFVKERMSEKEQRNITNSSHILLKLDEESEQEIKDELYHSLLYRISWSNLIQRIHSDLPDEEDEDEKEEDDIVDDDEYNSD